MTPEEELGFVFRELRLVTAGLAAWQAGTELGRFVEAVHHALGTVIGFNGGEVGIEAWSGQLATVGVTVHAGVYQELHAVYGCRNLSSHNNADALGITGVRVRRAYEAIVELVPRLAVQLGPKGPEFVAELRRTQTSAVRQLRAATLEDALRSSEALASIADAVGDVATPHLELRIRSLVAAATPAARLKRYLLVLGAQARDDAACPLRTLALDLNQRFCHPPLAAWIARDEQLAARFEPDRLNMLRVLVYPSEAGWTLVDAEVIHPADPELDKALPAFPIDAATLHDLGGCVKRLFKQLAAKARVLGLPDAAHDYVLQIAVPVEFATVAWEALRSGEHAALLTGEFLCITVEPIDDDRLEAQLPEPIEVVHVASIWEALELDDLRLRAGNRRVLLAGTVGWAHQLDGRPALLRAMDQRAAALVTDHASPEEAVDALLPGHTPRSWRAVLGTVRELRLTKRTVKVFWTDHRYSSLHAHPL